MWTSYAFEIFIMSAPVRDERAGVTSVAAKIFDLLNKTEKKASGSNLSSHVYEAEWQYRRGRGDDLVQEQKMLRGKSEFGSQG